MPLVSGKGPGASSQMVIGQAPVQNFKLISGSRQNAQLRSPGRQPCFLTNLFVLITRYGPDCSPSTANANKGTFLSSRTVEKKKTQQHNGRVEALQLNRVTEEHDRIARENRTTKLAGIIANGNNVLHSSVACNEPFL